MISLNVNKSTLRRILSNIEIPYSNRFLDIHLCSDHLSFINTHVNNDILLYSFIFFYLIACIILVVCPHHSHRPHRPNHPSPSCHSHHRPHCRPHCYPHPFRCPHHSHCLHHL